MVRTPKALGSGREIFETKAQAEEKICELKKQVGSGVREFSQLPRKTQSFLLLLYDRCEGDTQRLSDAVTLGLSRVATKQRVDAAVLAFNADHKASPPRKRAVGFVLEQFRQRFKDRQMMELDDVEILRWMNTRDWGPKMFNDARQALSQFWKYAMKRKWATSNAVADIPRRKLTRSLVPIYTPEEISAMLHGLSKTYPELIPFVAIGAFAGLRMTEIARLTCEQVRAAMKAGHLELTPEVVVKTGWARVVPTVPNLKAWLEKYLPKRGPVIPRSWKRPVGELSQYISRNSGVKWKPNALRHSFGTYRFKATDNVGQTVDEMGTSVEKFDRHYRNRSKIVTLESATAWFEIVP